MEPLTDGLLFLRFAFQFSGVTLTNNAVGPGCMRCDAAAILPYLSGLGLQLDIDGNTAVQPLSDGLLVLRYLFGFRDATLITGAIGQGATRSTAPVIEAYIETLL